MVFPLQQQNNEWKPNIVTKSLDEEQEQQIKCSREYYQTKDGGIT